MKTSYVLSGLLLLAACRKDDTSIPGKPSPGPVPLPEMLYTDLKNKEMKHQQPQFVDLDNDGSKDIGFGTWYIGDPLEKEDEVLFFAGSYVHSNLLLGENNNSPIFKQGDTIPVSNKGGYDWYQVGQVEMARKNIGEQGPPYWELDWRQVSHKYLAIQVMRDNKRYNGWIEVSFNTAGEKLILHKAAISKEAEKDIIAGK
jgi:hypothetical protein